MCPPGCITSSSCNPYTSSRLTAVLHPSYLHFSSRPPAASCHASAEPGWPIPQAIRMIPLNWRISTQPRSCGGCRSEPRQCRCRVLHSWVCMINAETPFWAGSTHGHAVLRPSVMCRPGPHREMPGASHCWLTQRLVPARARVVMGAGEMTVTRKRP